jgi:hypothetical protein
MASGSGEWYHECLDGNCGHVSATKSASLTCRDMNEQCAEYARLGTCVLCLCHAMVDDVENSCHEKMAPSHRAILFFVIG